MNLEELKKAVATFDWEGYEKIATDFAESVKKRSSQLASMIIDNKREAEKVSIRLSKGEIDRVGASRALERRNKAITALALGIKEAAVAEAAKKWWEAQAKLLDWAAMVASHLIKLI